MFKVPESSSPPSTPASRQKNRPAGRFDASNPSTTPAGPPPTSFSNNSTTPAGPPPSSIFGSAPFPSGHSFSRNDVHSSPLQKNRRRAQDDAADFMDEDRDMNSFEEDDQEEDMQFARSIEGMDVHAMARTLSERPSKLNQSGAIVLPTEHVLQGLHSYMSDPAQGNAEREEALSSAVRHLSQIWKSEKDPKIQTQGIGPGAAASSLSKAVFLTSLLLNFHHPPPRESSQRSFRASRDNITKPIPEILVDWLREYHDQYPDDFSEVMSLEDGPAAHERFWDVVFSLSLRGRLRDVAQLLREADFSFAVTAMDDGADEPGYRGKQLGNVQRVVNRAVSVLESSPAVQREDWNVKGNDWAIFRKKIDQALSDLETFAEGSNLDRSQADERPIHAENFGVSNSANDALSIGRMSQRAQSKVPWAIYESLKQLYGQLLGLPAEIVSASADWVEATIGMAIWWDGDEGEALKKNLASSRRSLMRSQQPRPADVHPVAAYQDKLTVSFRQISADYQEPELQVRSSDPVEVGMACIFEGDLDGLLGIVAGWSVAISAAVAEVAGLGGWLNESPVPSTRIMEGFDQNDLMVLSFAQEKQPGLDLDQILVGYAEILAHEPELHSQQLNRRAEGWQVAVQVLGRLHNRALANEEIASLLEALDMTDSNRVDNAMAMCNEINLPELGFRLSEQYAQLLMESSFDYGGAILYFSKAHNSVKVKNVLDKLCMSSLVNSMAYPPLSELDDLMAILVSSPEELLEELGKKDREAANILSSCLSGYATLRKFYELRDGDVGTDRDARSPSIARQREAAGALLAVIMSAADSIHGGLFDDSVVSVVPVDGLLVLLGEALMFVNRSRRVLDAPQIFALMQVAEDISTVSSGVFAQCEECLKSAIGVARGTQVAVPSESLLKKSASSLTASSQFSLVNSAMAASLSQHGATSEGSGVLVQRAAEDVHRGWDWRAGMGKGAKGTDVLRILRLGLAEEISKAWMDGDAGAF